MRANSSPIGLMWLIEDTDARLPAVRSYATDGNRRTEIGTDSVTEYYPRSYTPSDLVGHLRFALRYEPIEVGIWKVVLKKVGSGALEAWVTSEPLSAYARRAWFLYEMLLGVRLSVPDLPSRTKFIPLLDSRMQLTGEVRKVTRQRIEDNLLGTTDFCPMVRLTDALKKAVDANLGRRVKSMIDQVPRGTLARAVNYLYLRETRSSFEIEGEIPDSRKEARFMQALEGVNRTNVTSKTDLVDLQNAIVDARYAEKDWHASQNYIANRIGQVLYVCPQPDDKDGLMRGWFAMLGRLLGIDAVCAAALAGFGFVFIHPFGDGNGRIHRFLIHRELTMRGFSPDGIVLPVSATMLRREADYHAALDAYSKPLMLQIDYARDGDDLTVHGETVDLYRYFDATAQVEYLYRCIEEAISEELVEELAYICDFDEAMRQIERIVDMPNRRANSLVKIILQNHGKLSKNKRADFGELTDEEVLRIEEAVRASTGFWGYIFEGNWQESLEREIEILTDGIKKYPHSSELFTNRGVAYLESGDRYHSLLDLNEAIRLNPEDALAYRNRAVVHGRRSNYDSAIQDCNRSLELEPNCADAYVNRANAYAHKGDYKSAEEDLMLALKLMPELFEAHFSLGLLYKDTRQFGKAVDSFGRGIELASWRAEPYYLRSTVHALADDPQSALEDLAHALERNENYRDQAKKEKDFKKLRKEPAFIELTNVKKKRR